jgi:predicted nucleic acid-binding protein
VAFLLDTNVLVYRFDSRFPAKQARATTLLREAIASGEGRIAHQSIVEFMAAVTRRPAGGGSSILPLADARLEAEDLLAQFEVLYPDEPLVRLALRGMAAYGLSWFDAHLWAYAEHFGLSPLFSEDFQDGRVYGSVRVENPFRAG